MSSGFNAILSLLRRNSNSSRKSSLEPGATPLHKSFPQEPTNGVLTSGLTEIPLSVVAQHDDYNDCWVVIYDRVYDVTQFMYKHPGGEQIILEYAGRDATLAFNGSGHTRAAFEQLGEYLIGELPVKERLFRNDTSKLLSIGEPL